MQDILLEFYDGSKGRKERLMNRDFRKVEPGKVETKKSRMLFYLILVMGALFLLINTTGCDDNPDEDSDDSSYYEAKMEIEPGEVDVNGEVLCVFSLGSVHVTLEGSDGGFSENGIAQHPVVGSNITFTIIEGPAYFIDSDGNNSGLTSMGTGPTDISGQVLARIRAGDTPDSTNVIVRAVSDTTATATQSFLIERNSGLIEFTMPSVYAGTQYSVSYEYGGATPGQADYILPFTVEHTDGNGEPLANAEIVLDTYLQSSSINSFTLGESTALPLTLLTDDDGKSSFILYASVDTANVWAEGNIGSLVLTGTNGSGVRGSFPLIFNMHRVGENELSVWPPFAHVTDGLPVPIHAYGGDAPYTWSLAGSGTINETTGASITYTASTPAGPAVITLMDDAGESVDINITVWP